MSEELVSRAAKERRNTVQRADRPRQRRCAEEVSPFTRGWATVGANIEVRAASNGSTVDFHGVATAYERGYEMWDFFGPYTEIVTAGAGSESLARANLDVPLVLGHDSLRRLARTTLGSLTLTELDSGLDVLAPELSLEDADVAYIVPKLRSGLIDEMSFMFRITSGQWSPDYDEYRINVYDIHRGDVSIVGYGANPYTEANLREARKADPNQRAKALLELALRR